MKQGIQTFLAEAGESGCYALAIIQIACEETRREIDPVSALQRGISAGYIHYNEKDANDSDNFFVKDPAAFLTLLTGEGWTVEKVFPEYRIGPGERAVDRWERVVTGKVIGHFRLPEWDSLINSQTVARGKIASRRIFRRKR